MTIEESDAKFTIDDINTVGSAFVTLSEVNKLNELDRVTAQVKVTNVSGSDVVESGKKQAGGDGDQSGYARVTLWESDIGKLGVGICYQ